MKKKENHKNTEIRGKIKTESPNQMTNSKAQTHQTNG